MNRIVPHISIVMLNVNGQNAPLKRYRMAEWIRIHQPSVCCLQETQHIRKGWKKIFHANGHQKQGGIAIHISDKTNFKATAVKKDKEGNYIMIKGLVQQENITVLNIHTPNTGASTFTKQLLLDLRNEIDGNTVILGDFNTPLTALDRLSRQKLNKEKMDLNYTLEQMDLKDIYRTFYPTTTEYIISTWYILQDRPYDRPQNESQ
uniref:exodeoxyribonuclease III n=1 Tax=Homo sapiens TaxID=9606 RepID=A0AR24_HUMAN|nr:putative exonuclease [Homo sapiens]